MHEAEKQWLACADPQPMLAFLRDKHQARKVALFACACCRRIDYLLTDERSQHALEVVEQFHDGKVVHQVYTVAETAAAAAYADLFRAVDVRNAKPGAAFADGVRAVASMFAAQAAWSCFENPGGNAAQNCRGALRGFGTADIEGDEQSRTTGDKIEAAERTAQCALIRDIFGNPFQPVSLNPAWRSSTAIQLATSIYDDRAFNRMPNLADALQGAGCDDNDVLNHCREGGPHVRGCWVVDAVLGKV
jgi:hypothetical protein